MDSLKEVESFLGEFHAKYLQNDIVFMEEKMSSTHILLSLDISALEKRQIIESVRPADYIEGPLNNEHFGLATTWVFGKFHKQQELCIKLCVGKFDSSVICLSFIPSNKSLIYPYKLTYEKSDFR